MKYNSLLIWCFLLLAGVAVRAQTTALQVVTKTVSQTLPYIPGAEVNIEGEHAEIIVETWDKMEVRVIIELISKHPDRKTAEQDMHALKYSIDQYGHMIYFRNYISPDSGQHKPQSNLKAIYTITLPQHCPVYLKNNYGQATVSNLAKLLKLNTRFSNILLENLSGEIHLNTYFGDVEGRRLAGTVNINAVRSDLTLADISGRFSIRSEYGIVKLFSDQSLVDLDIVANRSDIYFFDPRPTEYGYQLTAHYGNITAPQDLKFNFLEKSGNVQKAVFSPGNEMATISVKISFGDIVIRNP